MSQSKWLLTRGAVLLPLAALAMATVPPVAAKAYTETVLHSFQGSDGFDPVAGLSRDRRGNLYGATGAGGSGKVGTLFELTPSGKSKTLWTFTGGTDGANPIGAPLLVNGNLYGTTNNGGANGKGVVYQFNLKTKTLTTLFAFDWQYGVYPQAPVIMDASGNLYGVTQNGGADQNQCDGAQGCGVVFELSPSGTYTILYSFMGGSDGVSPIGGLIRDAAGNLYGTTRGGFTNGTNNYGSVFKISPAGQETTLYTFTNTGIAQPWGSLTMDASGNLYGAAWDGGSSGAGGLFEISASGAYSVLYQFDGGTAGGGPTAGPLYRKGKLFGATGGGGNGYGAVYEFDLAKNTIKALYDFSGTPDGVQPGQGTLVRDPSGNLYGTTEFGGAGNCSPYNGCGTVFELSPGK